jgi:hypothetical protein
MHDILSLLECHLTTIELPKINNDFAGRVDYKIKNINE